MNNLVNISNSLDQIMVDITVRQMLNPDNKDFYIGTLTLDKVASMFAEMNKAEIAISEIFWQAYGIAQQEYKTTLAYEKVEEPSDACPKCGCNNYIAGVACPNCEYIED